MDETLNPNNVEGAETPVVPAPEEVPATPEVSEPVADVPVEPTPEAPAEETPVEPSDETPAADPVNPEPVELAPAPADEVEEEDPAAPKQLYLKGKPVVAIRNRLVNGRLYKEVETIDANTLLTEEDVAVQVTTDPAK